MTRRAARLAPAFRPLDRRRPWPWAWPGAWPGLGPGAGAEAAPRLPAPARRAASTAAPLAPLASPTATSSAPPPPLVVLRQASLPPSKLVDVDVALHRGEHAGVVGANASGKTALLRAVVQSMRDGGARVEVVDFGAHRKLVATRGREVVARVLGGLKDATDVVVKFGLTPIWWRAVGSLSTGEARRVLLAGAVSRDPDVLVLDRPFDGLDVKGRAVLKELLEDLTSGRKAAVRPLVQGIKWKSRAPPLLLIATHRPHQELPSAVGVVLQCAPAMGGGGGGGGGGGDPSPGAARVTKLPKKDFLASYARVLGGEGASAFGDNGVPGLGGAYRGDTSLVAERAREAEAARLASLARRVFAFQADGRAVPVPMDNSPLLDMFNVSVFPAQSDDLASAAAGAATAAPATVPAPPGGQQSLAGVDGRLTAASQAEAKRPLLDRASWTVRPREVWWVQGPNGASKSMLLSAALNTALLRDVAQSQHLIRKWTFEADPDADHRRRRAPRVTATESVGFVSTELHIALLEREGPSPLVSELVPHHLEELVEVLGLAPDLAARADRTRFSELSLGEQKLVLVARAMGMRPKLLVLDEACQSLDATRRRRVAEAVSTICTSPDSDVAALVVTHHEDELPRAVTHRIVLDQGRIVSRGPWHPATR